MFLDHLEESLFFLFSNVKAVFLVNDFDFGSSFYLFGVVEPSNFFFSLCLTLLMVYFPNMLQGAGLAKICQLAEAVCWTVFGSAVGEGQESC